MTTTPHVVVVGAGFAGHTAARRLLKRLRGRAHVTVIDRQDHFLYLPLLPEVAVGALEPRRIAVPLARSLRGARVVLGTVTGIDVAGRTVAWTDPDGGTGRTRYDRLVLAVGSVNKLLPIPGATEYAHGLRGTAEALYLRDHIVRQVELATATTDPDERAARLTFVTVGAGYTGTEMAAQGARLTALMARDRPALHGAPIRWMLLDLAPRVLPELSTRLSRIADRVLRERGVDVLTGRSIAEALPGRVKLITGEDVPTRTLIWCVGVRPDPLVDDLGLPTDQGRLVVDTDLSVPGHPEITACGDAAAVPDVVRDGMLTPMTAQHATRQGALAAHNVGASLGLGRPRDYRHHNLGFIVDLGGGDAAADPLGIPLAGLPATVVTRAYHLYSMPGNRIRVAADWLIDSVTSRQAVQLGIVRGDDVPLDTSTTRPPSTSTAEQDGKETPPSSAEARVGLGRPT